MSDLFNTDPEQLQMLNNFIAQQQVMQQQVMQQPQQVIQQPQQVIQQQAIQQQQVPVFQHKTNSIKLERQPKPVDDGFVFDTDLDFGDVPVIETINELNTITASTTINDFDSDSNSSLDFDLRNTTTPKAEESKDNNFDSRISSVSEKANGSTGLILSFLLLILYFITLFLANKEQVYSMNISLETFYILCPVAIIANAVAYKSLMGKIGGLLLIGVTVLVLIQGCAI